MTPSMFLYRLGAPYKKGDWTMFGVRDLPPTREMIKVATPLVGGCLVVLAGVAAFIVICKMIILCLLVIQQSSQEALRLYTLQYPLIQLLLFAFVMTGTLWIVGQCYSFVRVEWIYASARNYARSYAFHSSFCMCNCHQTGGVYYG